MGSYFKFRFIIEILSIAAVSVLIIVVALVSIYYKLSEYLKEKFGKRGKK